MFVENVITLTQLSVQATTKAQFTLYIVHPNKLMDFNEIWYNGVQGNTCIFFIGL